jgi:hypothetical protein
MKEERREQTFSPREGTFSPLLWREGSRHTDTPEEDER